MSRRTFVGTSVLASQIWKGTITTTTNGHTYIVTLTDEFGGTIAITYVVANPPDTTTTLVATGFVTAWNASTDPRVAAITATQVAGQVILTADASGVPFRPVASGTGTWSGTGNTTANSGPSDLNDPGNYAELIVPVAGDDVTFVSGTILYGLQQQAVFTGEMIFASSFTGSVGSAGLPLDFTPSSFVCNSSGSGKMFMDFNAAAIPLMIGGTGSPSTGYGLNIIGGSALTVVTINSGSVAIAAEAGETATVVTVANNGGDVLIGNSVTITSFLQGSGDSVLNSGGTTASCNEGTLTTQGTGTWTNLLAKKSGTIISNSSGTVTAATADDGGTIDFTQSRVLRTLTGGTIGRDGAFLVDSGVLTITNGIQPSGAVQIQAKAA